MKHSRGFTLIELVVVLGLFMLIMGITVSIFISIIQQQKRILSQQEMLSQAGFAQEFIFTALRGARPDTAGICLIEGARAYQGRVYLPTRFDAGSGFFQGVKFLSAGGICREIFLDGDGALKEIAGLLPARHLLSPRFEISYARFSVSGAARPRISLALNVKDPSYENSQATIIQVTVSNR